MRAYKIQIIGQQQPYFVTEKQGKLIMDLFSDNKETTSMLAIGDNMVRISSIKNIMTAEVHIEDMPDYFKRAAEREAKKQPQTAKYITNLPTKWIVLTQDFKPVFDENGRIASPTKYKPNGLDKWIMAKVYYKIGEQGEEYLLRPEQIPEYMTLKWDEENQCSLITRRFVYGLQRQ